MFQFGWGVGGRVEEEVDDDEDDDNEGS